MGETMGYEMEELLPLVGDLAAKYTSNDSTSITNEVARRLMGSVLFCIGELGRGTGGRDLMSTERLSAKEAYRLGYEAAYRKVKKAMDLYQAVLRDYCDYGNRCYYDTVIKGIPEFFLHYDLRFDATDTVIMEDYPLMVPMRRKAGIDEIYSYLSAVYLEQAFLKCFDEGRVRYLLSHEDGQAGEQIFNLCQTVFRSSVGCAIVGKEPASLSLERGDFKALKCFAESAVPLADGLASFLPALPGGREEKNQSLHAYLSKDVTAFAAEYLFAAERECLERIFPVYQQSSVQG